MIIIHCQARKLRDGKRNPKDYPFWDELIKLIKEPIVQIGIEGEKQFVPDFRKNLSLKDLEELVRECSTFITIDSFFHHFCWDLGKKGIVLWGQSDPLIFGHKENTNLLKGREYLREKQFDLWEETEYNKTRYRDDCWVNPQEVVKYIL